MAFPKLEGLIDVTTAWTMAVVETGGGTKTVTVLPVGTYYLTGTGGVLATIAAALTGDSTLAATYALTLDDDTDTGTGKVTLAASGGSVTKVAFTYPAGSPAPATVLGLAASNNALSFTGASQAQYLWLPNCGRAPGLLAPDGDAGANVEDFTQVTAPSGRTVTYRLGSGRYEDVLGFGLIRGNKAWKTYETTTNESLQRFWEQVIRDGHPFRYHKDRSADATYVTWKAEAGAQFECPPIDPTWWSASALYQWSSRVRSAT